MAGRNDFLIFNENKDNMLTQDLYQADSDRLDGFKKGIARSNVNNKVLHQTSMMCHAFGELLKEIDLNASDEMTVAELTKNLKDLLSSNGGGGLEILDIGFSPFPIDETQNKRRLLNGQIIIQEQFVSFTNKVKKAKELYPGLFCTEEEWQTTVTMSTFGQCGKFVINDEAGTIRLPKITGFIQGLTDLASLGELVEAGLPSISHTHTRGTMNITGTLTNSNGRALMWDNKASVTATGAFTSSGSGNNSNAGTNGTGTNTISFDASRNWTGATSTNSAISALYGKSSTVQPEAIRYPYFIQVATGAEESVDVTREIELNNPFFFGYYQYFEVAPNNISWLKSQGQWNSKAIYTDYYDWILTNANNGVANFKLSTDTYDDYAWVVNTADEIFRLPIKTKNAPLSNSKVKINSYDNESLDTSLLTRPRVYYSDGTSLKNGRLLATTSTGRLTAEADVGSTSMDNALLGLYADLSDVENTNVSLYFYVGETTQNANLINAGRIEEVVVNKVNRTGDTMTGKLNYNFTSQEGNGVEAFRVRIKDDNYTIDNSITPTAEKRLGGIGIFDANDVNIGNVYMYKNKSDQVAMGMNVMRTVNGATKTSYVRIYVDNTGQPLIDFPKCTTKATTTSSAKSMLPAVITQNYVSGTSWYRVWSDGWIEQGGSSAFSSKNTATITFAKKFASTPTINISGTFNEIAEIEVNALTTSNFTWTLNTARTGTIYYYACGY